MTWFHTMANDEQPTGDLEQLARELAELRTRMNRIDERLARLESPPANSPAAGTSEPELIIADEEVEIIEAISIENSDPLPGRPPKAQRPAAAVALEPDVSRTKDDRQHRQPVPIDANEPFARVQELLGEQWEQIVGGRWMTWAGALTLIVAMAFFVPWAWTELDLPDWSKVLLLHTIGIGISIAALVLYLRDMKIFAHGLAGVGIFTLYASAWAAQHHYSIWDSYGDVVTFAECVLITTLAIAAAVSSRSVAMVLLGALGGYLTPIIAGGSESMHIALFSYLAFLNVALVGSAVLRSWSFLKPLALLATIIMFALWLTSGAFDGESHTWSTQCLLSLHWFIFLLGATLPPVVWQRSSNWLDLFPLSVNSLWFVVATWALFHARPEQQLALVCWGMTVLHLALFAATYNRVTNVDRMPRVHLALAAIFFILAMPLQLEDSLSLYLALSWAAQGVVLSAVGIYFRDRQLCTSSLIVFALAGIRLMAFDYPADPVMLDNIDRRCVMFLVTSLLMIVGGTLYPLAGRLIRKEQENPQFWESAGGVLMAAGNLLAMIGLTCQWDSRLILLLWTIDAATIWAAGFVMRRMNTDGGAAMRTYGMLLGVLLLGGRALYHGDTLNGAFTLLLNERFGTLLLMAVVYFAAAWSYRMFIRTDKADERFSKFEFVLEKTLDPAIALLANLVLLVALSLEIHSWFDATEQIFSNTRMAEQAAYSILFAVYAATAVIVGLVLRWPVLRYLGLTGFVLTLAKVFFVDLSSLELLPRVLALAVLGMMLLGVSFVYQRFQKKISKQRG